MKSPFENTAFSVDDIIDMKLRLNEVKRQMQNIFNNDDLYNNFGLYNKLKQERDCLQEYFND